MSFQYVRHIGREISFAISSPCHAFCTKIPSDVASPRWKWNRRSCLSVSIHWNVAFVRSVGILLISNTQICIVYSPGIEKLAHVFILLTLYLLGFKIWTVIIMQCQVCHWVSIKENIWANLHISWMQILNPKKTHVWCEFWDHVASSSSSGPAGVPLATSSILWTLCQSTTYLLTQNSGWLQSRFILFVPSCRSVAFLCEEEGRLIPVLFCNAQEHLIAHRQKSLA